ncbi:iron(III) transport system substrate-binding protein [Alkalispirochaeta americana]|uniref:Iron(III) transport system substrate-binding protein n=1 Tax=Alkalispirochaeta americana TaxID=159291 RepID=A0A1N6UDI3_9SPIO|nr:iron ABC transporter substrate-binding protein [Alkalispirochaeta americana]SIQ63659.1 iron(III) transport system substrate-binding protein [Alkalispirochaeta americana]
MTRQKIFLPLLRSFAGILLCLGAATPLFARASSEQSQSITLYSGRGESLVAPLIEEFTRETGIVVHTRFGGTSELAVLIQEEGTRSPADLFWAQDAGALGALSRRGLFRSLPEDILKNLPEMYRNSSGDWAATSGRARVIAYNPQVLGDLPLPETVFELTRPEYSGSVAWAPTNGSFQSFLSGMRALHGDEATTRWLSEMISQGTQSYRNNTAILEALGAGEIALGITNHYYLLRFLAEDPDFPVQQAFFTDGDIGNLVNVAGVGILDSAQNSSGAEAFLRFLLERSAQEYFTSRIYEYPVIDGIGRNPRLEPFQRLIQASPSLNLDALEDLEGTLSIMRRAGAL